MAICNSIPAHTADKITAKLNDAAAMLRAMRDIAHYSGENDDCEAVSVAVEGLSERAHLIVDSCIQKMDNYGLLRMDNSEQPAGHCRSDSIAGRPRVRRPLPMV